MIKNESRKDFVMILIIQASIKVIPIHSICSPTYRYISRIKLHSLAHGSKAVDYVSLIASSSIVRLFAFVVDISDDWAYVISLIVVWAWLPMIGLW